MIEKIEKRKHMLSLLARREHLHSQTLRVGHSVLELELANAQDALDENQKSIQNAESALQHMLGGSEALDLSQMTGMRDYMLVAEESLENAQAEFQDVQARYESSLDSLKRSELNKRLFDRTATRLKGEVSMFKDREAERMNAELWITSQWSEASR